MSDGLELRWPGKYDAHGQRAAIPRPGASLVRRVVYPPGGPPPSPDESWCNRLIEADNLVALDALMGEHAAGVDLVYIDPPFATGGRFDVVTPVGERPPRGRGLEIRRPAYDDSWPGGVSGLISMLDPRLRLVHALLAPHGSLYVHVDPTVGHAVKLLLDEIFGPSCFQREIVWRIGWVSGFKTRARNWIRNHDLLFFYVKDPARFTFNKHYMPHPPGYRRRDGSLPQGRGVPLDDVWNAGDAELALRGRDSLDSIQIKSFSTEKTGYATQKNESLLRRIIEASSNPGDLVVDVFCGSGTTLAVAEQLGRRWIGCDVGRSAIHLATARLLAQERRYAIEVTSAEFVGEPPREGPWCEPAGAAWERRRGETGWGDASLTVVTGEGPCEAPVAAAWQWSQPIDVQCDDDGALIGAASFEEPVRDGATLRLVLQPELLNPAKPSDPPPVFAQRGKPSFRLRGLASGVIEVELLGVNYDCRALLPESLRDAVLRPLDWIDWWTVTWDEDSSDTVDVVLGRFDRRRTLTTRSPAHRYSGPGGRLVVRIYDAFHRDYRLECRLVRGDGRWTVTEARLQTPIGRPSVDPDSAAMKGPYRPNVPPQA